MRRWVIRLAVLVILVAAVLVLRRTVLAPKPVPVTVVAAQPGTVEETVTNSRAGTVKARRRAELSPEVGGRVVAITHREGEAVQAGEILVRLDPSVYDAQVSVREREIQAALAQREQACAAAERTARERDRLRKLAGEGIVSADALDQADSAARAAAAGCRAAQAGIEQARSGLELARRQSQQLVLRAPFDGVIADLTVELGEWTTPSPPAMPVPPVLDLIDPASIYVSAPMDEVDSARIHPGQPVRVTIDSYPGRSFPGRVSQIAPYVLDREEQNRTVAIEVELDPKPEGLRLLPGTSADVEVILETREGALRVPTSTLIEGDKVLVITQGKLAERQLKIGLKNWDWTEVREGLRAGETVVTSLDRPEVKAGAAVEVVKEIPK